MCLRFFGASFLLSFLLFAAELEIKQNQTEVRSSASQESELIGELKKGVRVQSAGTQGSFTRILSRSRRKLWVLTSSLSPIPANTHCDLECDVQAGLSDSGADFKRIRLDLGGARGAVQGYGFFEGAVGMEYFMMERLSWRNAVFFHSSDDGRDFFGLDSSFRGNGNLPLGPLELRGIIGAGYRLASKGFGNAPFGELGAFASLGGFDIGFTLKYLANSLSQGSSPDVVIYSLVLSGGAGYF